MAQPGAVPELVMSTLGTSTVLKKEKKKKALPIPLGSILTPLEANTAQRENSATCWLSVTVQGALITHSNKSYNGFTPLLLY